MSSAPTGPLSPGSRSPATEPDRSPDQGRPAGIWQRFFSLRRVLVTFSVAGTIGVVEWLGLGHPIGLVFGLLMGFGVLTLAPLPWLWILPWGLRYLESIPVTYLKDIVLLPVAEVTHFEADQELVAIHERGARQYTTDLTLAELEQRLDPGRFFRAHRRSIINLDHLLRLEPLEGGRYVAVLGQGTRVELSRTGSRRLRKKLGL